MRAGPGAGSGRAADDQVHRQAAGLCRAAVQNGQQGAHAALTDLFCGQPHRGEFGLHGRGQGQIVEAGHGEVVRYPQSEPACGLAGARGQDVVVADDGRGPGAGKGQCAFRGRVAGPYVQRRRHGAHVGAGHAAQGVPDGFGADRERPGVDGGGEMDEAAVAEGEQMLRHLTHPVGDVEVDAGRRTRGRGVAVEHDQGQVGPVQGAQRVGGHR